MTLDEMKAEHELEAVRRMLSSVDGREFAWALLEQVGLYRLSFSGEETQTASFLDGRRSIGLWFIQLLDRVAPDEYTRLRAEAVARAEFYRERFRTLQKADDQVE